MFAGLILLPHLRTLPLCGRERLHEEPWISRKARQVGTQRRPLGASKLDRRSSFFGFSERIHGKERQCGRGVFAHLGAPCAKSRRPAPKRSTGSSGGSIRGCCINTTVVLADVEIDRRPGSGYLAQRTQRTQRRGARTGRMKPDFQFSGESRRGPAWHCRREVSARSASSARNLPSSSPPFSAAAARESHTRL
jgi:hypothetical protein